MGENSFDIYTYLPLCYVSIFSYPEKQTNKYNPLNHFIDSKMYGRPHKSV